MKDAPRILQLEQQAMRWPAEWGNAGVMNFIVIQQGGISQGNPGPKTAKIAGDMKVYDPDDTWTAVQ